MDGNEIIDISLPLSELLVVLSSARYGVTSMLEREYFDEDEWERRNAIIDKQFALIDEKRNKLNKIK